MRIPVGVFVTLSLVWAETGQPDAQTIIERSVEANNRDWAAAPHYDYFKRVHENGDTKTYHVLMIRGSSYQQLVSVNGNPLPPDQQQEEKRKLEQATEERSAESESQHAQRVAKYEKERQRDHTMLSQLTKAFDFELTGVKRVDSHQVYVLRATPRPGYNPPNRDSEVLPGMRGKLWIDTQTFQWVKVEANVVHPVSIEGFLAQVEPGTRFELEYEPVADGIWLPTHFSMKSKARILFFFTRRQQDEETYYGYTKAKAANAGD
jgi:hypothetical protein